MDNAATQGLIALLRLTGPRAEMVMPRTFKINIAGSGAETDAPAIGDLIEQLRDYFDILRGVEEALAEDGRIAIEWRIVNASKNSPLSLEAAAFPLVYATNVNARAERVLSQTSKGLRSLQDRDVRPEFFSEKTLGRAERFFDRVTNGLGGTFVDNGPDLPSISVNRTSARIAVKHVDSVLRPQPKAYKELGSVEGIAHGVDKDGWGNPIVKFRLRSTGDELTCRLSGEALSLIASRQVGEVLRSCRVQLYGTIYYKALGQISKIDAFRARILRDSADLPNMDAISDTNFSGGIRSELFLEEVRRGGSN